MANYQYRLAKSTYQHQRLRDRSENNESKDAANHGFCRAFLWCRHWRRGLKMRKRLSLRP
ncbi:MAG: hypothetical protein VX269_09205 [Verrucomicrobiota bacterium]|nr:hypothetical protein [Verrucomicrobiota bacterium]